MCLFSTKHPGLTSSNRNVGRMKQCIYQLMNACMDYFRLHDNVEIVPLFEYPVPYSVYIILFDLNMILLYDKNYLVRL